MPDFLWKQGDSGPTIVDSLSLTDGVPINVAHMTPGFRLRSLMNAGLVSLTGTVEWTDDEGGVQFIPSAADTSNPVGNYMAEWTVTDQLGHVQTFPTDGYIWGRIEPTAATAPPMIVDLETVKEHLGPMASSDRGRDARLLRLIKAITPMIEAQVGPIALTNMDGTPRIFEEWFDGGSNIHDVIRQPSSGFGTTPVFTVIAVSEYRGPIEYPLSLVASPSFGSIYSVFVNYDQGTITRRTAGGATLAFMPGRESVHILYQAGQKTTPPNVVEAALEMIRVSDQWTKQLGRGSLAPADAQEIGPVLSMEMTRIVRMYLAPTRRFPAFA